PGHDAARCAHETPPRSLQLLRRQRQLAELEESGACNRPHLVPMALPPKPQDASQLGAIQRSAFAYAASHAPHHRSAVGCLTVSRTSGGAGWWQSPSPDLARAPVVETAGATRHEAECTFSPEFMRGKREE